MREYWSLEKIADEFEMENFYGTNLLSYDVSQMDKATWVDFRSNLLGIGGSGIGTILGMNLYKDPLTYFYEIIGLIKGNFKDNPYTFWGTMFEEAILKSWQYWDGTDESMWKNMNNDTPVSLAHDPYKTYINPKYPYLFANLDGIITKHRDYGSEPGILEIKNLSAQYGDRFKVKAPRQYFLQVHQYMLVMGLSYGELAIRNNKGEFLIFPIKKDDRISEKILRTSTRFMEAVKLALDNLPSIDNEEQALDLCIQIENDYRDVLTVGTSKEIQKYMSERHQIRESLVQIEPNAKFEDLAVRYVKAKDLAKQAEQEAIGLGNEIRREMTARSANRVEGDGWHIAFKKRLMVSVTQKKKDE